MNTKYTRHDNIYSIFPFPVSIYIIIIIIDCNYYIVHYTCAYDIYDEFVCNIPNMWGVLGECTIGN